MRIVYLISAVVVVLSMTGSVLAIDHWWHGGVSANVNDPANWTDRDASTEPTTPTGDPRDIVRIGGSWDSEDLDGNGVLDPGEDLNGNGVIDDPDPNSGIGWGGYYGDGGGIDLPVDPVLSETYVSRTGTAEGGWWFVLNAPNILTLQDGAFLIMDEENCNLRNGGRIEVQGRSDTDGPSLITAGHFRIAENGSVPEAAHETSQLRINGTGWVLVDASLDGGNDDWFRIGTSDPPGTMPRGEVIIEDSGRIEVLAVDPAPYVLFGNADPSVNQIIIRDNGELWLPGDPATMGVVGPNDVVTSLQEMIDMGLITSDTGILTVSGTDPTVVKAEPVTQLEVAGELLVDISAADPSAGTETWINNGTLGDFNFITEFPEGSSEMTAGTPDANLAVEEFEGVPVVHVMSGAANVAAYMGPEAPASIIGSDDRSCEIWVADLDAELPKEQPLVAWGARGAGDGGNCSLSLGYKGYGAFGLWGDDFDMGFSTLPTVGTLHHLVFVIDGDTATTYVDGLLDNTRTFAGTLNTPAAPINLFIQNKMLGDGSLALDSRLLPDNIVVNSIRVHDGVLTDAQVLNNYIVGPRNWPDIAPVGLGADAAYSMDTSIVLVGNADEFTSLDGTWLYSTASSDRWDGSGIGEGSPGGISTIDGYLRIQDTGDPRDYGYSDPGSNRKLYLLHDMGPDGATTTILDDGVTLFFRMRLATDGLLDQQHPNGGAGLTDVPATGDGYLIHDKGKGFVGIKQGADGRISFSLTTVEEYGESGLLMNSLNGTTVSNDVDTGKGTPNLLPLDPTVWHDFLVTIQADPSGVGTHQVDVSVNGAPAQTFVVTAGSGEYHPGMSYLALGVASTNDSGAFDLAAFQFAPGIIMP